MLIVSELKRLQILTYELKCITIMGWWNMSFVQKCLRYILKLSSTAGLTKYKQTRDSLNFATDHSQMIRSNT